MNGPIDMRGRICLVTGANSGIGKATALGLAKLGATVVMVCRNEERGQAAQTDIMTQSGNKSVDLFVADLAAQSTIRQLADAFKAKYPRLHVLINNAGVNLSRRTITADGIEATFAVNYLAPFLLTHLLLDVLEVSAPARIINLGFPGFAGSKRGSLALDDLMRSKRYRPLEVYHESKVALLLFTYELARRIRGTGVTANSIAPGFTRTNLGHDTRGLLHLYLKATQPFMKSPADAAEAIVYLATSPDIEGMNGWFFRGKNPVNSPEKANDLAQARQLWQISEQLTKPSVVEA
jgi:retinol dehydrogenase-14